MGCGGGRLQLLLRGSAGQSFACFVVAGMDVKLVGEANDYVGKGMAGGDVTIVPPPGEPPVQRWPGAHPTGTSRVLSGRSRTGPGCQATQPPAWLPA